MTRQKILVTGATGHRGSAPVAELRRYEWPVRDMVSRLGSRGDAGRGRRR